MALKISVKNSQSDFVNTGMLFQGTWYVDNSLPEGLESATFCGIKGGQSACLVDGKMDQATLWPAGTDALKASGIVYKQSARDRYGRTDDMTDETRYYPYGIREDKAIGLLKKGVIEVSSTENQRYRHWYTCDTAVLERDLKHGDLVKTDEGTAHVVSVNKLTGKATITEGTLTLVDGKATALCQIDAPLFLNTAVTIKPEDKGAFAGAEGLPFTTIKPESGIVQLVGYVESAIAARIDLTLHVDAVAVVI